jgi:predicted GTPase
VASPKKVIILGKNGVGKSFILNRLLKRPGFFRSGFDTQPITRDISHGEAQFQIESGSMTLCAFDTPGKIFDSFRF